MQRIGSGVMMSTLHQLTTRTSQSLAAKKEALLEEAIEKYYGHSISKSFVIQNKDDFHCKVAGGVETYYVQETPVLEIYPVESVVDEGRPWVLSFDFKYRSLI